MRNLTVGILVFVLLLAFAEGAAAQNAGSVELGYDASFEIWFIDDVTDNLYSVGVPGGGMTLLSPQRVRIGYLFSEAGELEFPLGFSLINDGDESYWLMAAGLYGMYNFRSSGKTAIPFLRGGGTLNVIHDGSDTYTQFSVGAGVGTRIMVADRLAVRLGAGVERSPETDDLRGHTDLLFDVGLSFFTPGKETP